MGCSGRDVLTYDVDIFRRHLYLLSEVRWESHQREGLRCHQPPILIRVEEIRKCLPHQTPSVIPRQLNRLVEDATIGLEFVLGVTKELVCLRV